MFDWQRDGFLRRAACYRSTNSSTPIFVEHFFVGLSLLSTFYCNGGLLFQAKCFFVDWTIFFLRSLIKRFQLRMIRQRQTSVKCRESLRFSFSRRIFFIAFWRKEWVLLGKCAQNQSNRFGIGDCALAKCLQTETEYLRSICVHSSNRCISARRKIRREKAIAEQSVHSKRKMKNESEERQGKKLCASRNEWNMKIK